MATRQQAIDGINSIGDNLQNNAAKVRNVLMKVLEYTEETPTAQPTNNLSVFAFQGSSIDFRQEVASLNYSMRLLSTFAVSFTFELTYLNTGKDVQLTPLYFDIGPANYNKLTSLMREDLVLDFAVPFLISALKPKVSNYTMVRMGLSLDAASKMLLLDFTGNSILGLNLNNTNSIRSSLQFHSPPLDIKKTTALKTKRAPAK
jgi:hypothetical protein